MGLDSVELVMEVEDYFAISIPDAEAQNIYTVQNMVDCIARHLSVSSNDERFKHALFEKIKSFLIENKKADHSLSIFDSIFDFLDPDDTLLWTKLSVALGLELPVPYRAEKGFFQNVLPAIFGKPDYNWKTISVDAFITAVAANNYKKVIDTGSITNSYEILISVIGITVYKLGLDMYEVQPHKSFVNDFGIS